MNIINTLSFCRRLLGRLVRKPSKCNSFTLIDLTCWLIRLNKQTETTFSIGSHAIPQPSEKCSTWARWVSAEIYTLNNLTHKQEEARKYTFFLLSSISYHNAQNSPGNAKQFCKVFICPYLSNPFNDENFSLSKRQFLNQKIYLSALLSQQWFVSTFTSYPDTLSKVSFKRMHEIMFFEELANLLCPFLSINEK